MTPIIFLFLATLVVNAMAYPSVQNKSSVIGTSTRIVRAAYANPQHFDRVHCLPHEDHVDCHIDHHDGYSDYNQYAPSVDSNFFPPKYPPTNPQSENSYADTSAKSFAINTPLGGISFSDAKAHSGTHTGGLLGALLE